MYAVTNHSELIDSVLIPGVYDILSPDHKSFLLSCMDVAQMETGIKDTTIGLAPDRSATEKGRYRPFYTFDWRRDDISEWHTSLTSHGSLEFTEFCLRELIDSPPHDVKYKIATLSSHYRGTIIEQATLKLAARTIFVPPVNQAHTTDIENALTEIRNSANCTWRVGATLLRNGGLIGSYRNGGIAEDSCQSCSKQIDIQRTLHRTGSVLPSLVPCDFSHAEKQATLAAQNGDHLITTVSPCQECAESIAVSGITRVVYLRPYHSPQNPIATMRESGVQVAQAGYRRNRLTGLPEKI